MTSTSCGFIQHGRVKSDHSGGQTYGGWSKKITAHRRFISLIPKSYPLEKAGPVFCGGITMFSPLFENGAFKGKVKCPKIISSLIEFLRYWPKCLLFRTHFKSFTQS